MDNGQGGADRTERLKKHRQKLTHEQFVENGRKGGIQHGINMKRRRTIKEDLLAILSEVPNGKDGKTMQEYWVRALAKNLLRGDVKTSVFVRDTIGEMPRQPDDENEMEAEAIKGITIKFVDGSKTDTEDSEKGSENDEED